MSNWEAEIAKFVENHPDKPDLFPDEISHVQAQLDLARKYEKFTQTVVFADMCIFIEQLRMGAYGSLLCEEKARLATNPENFKSDAYYKGVLSTLSALRQHIEEKANAVTELENEFRELDNPE